MKTFTYKVLPPLQTFIFGEDEANAPNFGIVVMVKLNDNCAVSLGQLFPERKENGSILSEQVSSGEVGVIPIDVGIPHDRLHMLVVQADLWRRLLGPNRP